MIRPLDQSRPANAPQQSKTAKPRLHKPFDLGTPATAAPTGPAQPSLVPAELPRTLASLQIRRQEIDTMIERSLGGQQLSAQQLLVWQAKVYDYSQRMELFSRVVDRTVGAIKTTLNTQV